MTKLAVFDWQTLSDHNLAKLKAFQSNGWDVALVGNGLDCQSYKIHASECKQGQFFGYGEKEIYSVSVASNNDVYLVFVDGTSILKDHDYDQSVWIKDNSIRAEVTKMQALLQKLDLKLGLLCPDNGFSVYFVRPFKQFYGTYFRTQSCAEGKGLNFRLPNDGMLQIAKKSFGYRELKTVHIKLWWIYHEWQEKTKDEFVFIGES